MKHEVKVHLFNLHGADFGNPALPSKVAQANVAAAKLQRSRFSWRVAAAVWRRSFSWLGFGFGTIGAGVATETWLPDKSIAVLPFENFSDDKASGYFADGIQDDILTSLAKIRDLRVISRTSVEKYRGASVAKLARKSRRLLASPIFSRAACVAWATG